MGQSAGERVAAKGGAVVAREDALRNGFGHEGRANGEAVAERFCRRENVGVRGGGQVAVRPEGTGAGEPALDFIVDEHGADFVTAVSERLQELQRAFVDAAFALDRLD